MSERAKGLTRQQMCDRLAMEFGDGWIVNLGIGIPTLCSNFDFGDKQIIFHSENGVIGYGPLAAPGNEDLHLVNAGGQHVTLQPGAAIVHRAPGVEAAGHARKAAEGAGVPHPHPLHLGGADLAVGHGETGACGADVGAAAAFETALADLLPRLLRNFPLVDVAHGSRKPAGHLALKVGAQMVQNLASLR